MKVQVVFSLGMAVATAFIVVGGMRQAAPREYKSNGYRNVGPKPRRSPLEIASARAQRDSLAQVRRLSESGHDRDALQALDESARKLSRPERQWAVVNDRVWSDVLLRNGEFAALLDAYAAQGAQGAKGVEGAPAAVTIADVSLNGRPLLPTAVTRASISRFVPIEGAIDELPSEGTPAGLLALAYLKIGQDYHMEANPQAARWYFERAARVAPHNAFCAWELARVLEELGGNAAASATIRQAYPARTAGFRSRMAEESASVRAAQDRKG